jgi:hypothetical protein
VKEEPMTVTRPRRTDEQLRALERVERVLRGRLTELVPLLERYFDLHLHGARVTEDTLAGVRVELLLELVGDSYTDLGLPNRLLPEEERVDPTTGLL